MDHQYDSSSEDVEASAADQPAARKAPWRPLMAATAVLAATATIGAFSWSGRPARTDFDSNAVTGLEKAKESLSEMEQVCAHLPFLRLEKLVSSNLGGDGPDKDAEEGLIYKAKGFHMGLGDADNLEVHIHAVTEYHGHNKDEGQLDSKVDPEYKPAWPKMNGLKGHFASVNIKPGSNVTMRVHCFDATTKKDLHMDKFAMTFFDLDTGSNGTHSVEYVHIGGFDNYFTTNETEVDSTEQPDGTYVFRATKEGTGADNPDDPLELTKLQKNRVVSFIFTHVDEGKFEIGATAGKTARIFNFALRPALRCAWTKRDNGRLIASDDPNSPVTILKGIGSGGASGTGPAAAILAAAIALCLFN